mmetsp:Transcript_4736/g.13241  ORF Transcript_4736/g.13241 Transcript_4736/m.13241 type:complete len:187 (-) Transcript_4736:272-832(-)
MPKDFLKAPPHSPDGVAFLGRDIAQWGDNGTGLVAIDPDICPAPNACPYFVDNSDKKSIAETSKIHLVIASFRDRLCPRTLYNGCLFLLSYSQPSPKHNTLNAYMSEFCSKWTRPRHWKMTPIAFKCSVKNTTTTTFQSTSTTLPLHHPINHPRLTANTTNRTLKLSPSTPGTPRVPATPVPNSRP